MEHADPRMRKIAPQIVSATHRRVGVKGHGIATKIKAPIAGLETATIPNLQWLWPSPLNTFYFCGRCPLPPPTERTDVAVPLLRHGRRRERRRREFGRNGAYRQLVICRQGGSWDSPSESCFALAINLRLRGRALQ